MVNRMLFKTVVLLTSRVKLLINGVAPAACPVIVIVVSSASLAPTRFVRTIRTATLMIEHVFITRFLGALREELLRVQLMPVVSACVVGPALPSVKRYYL